MGDDFGFDNRPEIGPWPIYGMWKALEFNHTQDIAQWPTSIAPIATNKFT